MDVWWAHDKPRETMCSPEFHSRARCGRKFSLRVSSFTSPGFSVASGTSFFPMSETTRRRPARPAGDKLRTGSKHFQIQGQWRLRFPEVAKWPVDGSGGRTGSAYSFQLPRHRLVQSPEPYCSVSLENSYRPSVILRPPLP